MASVVGTLVSDNDSSDGTVLMGGEFKLGDNKRASVCVGFEPCEDKYGLEMLISSATCSEDTQIISRGHQSSSHDKSTRESERFLNGAAQANSLWNLEIVL